MVLMGLAEFRSDPEFGWTTRETFIIDAKSEVQYREYSIQAREALTNRKSMVSKSQELGFGVCHEKVRSMLVFGARCLVGRLARAMTKKRVFMLGQFEF